MTHPRDGRRVREADAPTGSDRVTCCGFRPIGSVQPHRRTAATGSRTVLSASEVELFRAGDPSLFRHVVEAITPRLLFVSRTYARDPDHADDLVQETWIRAYQKRHQFTGHASLTGWLMAICRTVCLAQLQRPSTRIELALDDTENQFASTIATNDVDQLTALEREEDSGTLLSALARLTERQRSVVALRLIDGLSTRETAAVLGRTEGTIKATLSQALVRMEAMIGHYER